MPGTPHVEVDPDLIFLFILPPLLYIAAFFTPLRSLRANLGTICSLAVGLVVVSAVAVAAVAHALMPGIPWAVAIALGAIVAPPDAIAAAAIASRLAVPRRIVTVLEGESLLNDATALTIYSIAIAVAVGGAFTASAGVRTFVGAMLGGWAIGLAVGWIIATDPSAHRGHAGGDHDLAPHAVRRLPPRPAARRFRGDRDGGRGPVPRPARLAHHGGRRPAHRTRGVGDESRSC